MRDIEVATLVRIGLLDREMRDDAGEMIAGLYRYLDDTLGRLKLIGVLL